MRPHDDSFLDAPHDLAALAPGTVIRTRPVEVAFLGIVPQSGVSAVQLAYRSTDLHGRAEVAVTTVLTPAGGTAEPQRMIAYQCAIDAVSARCFPSYALRKGVFVPGALPPLELLMISAFLERGFVVGVADHEGRLGTFGAPREPGHRVLDGVRATLAHDELGLAPDTPVGLYGYSGGGMASAWAAEMAPSYAPELNLVGAALGSPVGDPGEAFIKLNNTFFAGLPAMVVAGLAKVYPGLGRVIDEYASAEGRRRLRRLEKHTTTGAILRHCFDDFDDYLDAPLSEILELPEMRELFDDLRLGERIPDCPLLVVQACNDQIIDVVDVDALVDRYLAGGATVRYARARFSEHTALMLTAQPMMVSWLADRFADVPAPEETTTVASMTLSLRAWLGYAAMARTALGVLTGRGGRTRAAAAPVAAQPRAQQAA